MTIDWSKEVETTEDPPRPVRVLFDKDGRPEAVYIADNGSSLSFNLFALEHVGTGISATRGMYSIPLRNVAPPKPEPVLLEGWLNLYRNGALTVHFSDDDAQVCNPNGAAETRRIAWMSDGSPAPSEASGEGHTNCWANYNLMLTGRDHWKARAEALQAEVERLQEVEREWCALHHAAVKELQAEVDKRNDSILDHLDRIQEMKPVVDAAVAWTNAEGNEAIILTGRALMDASRTYQSKQAPAEPVKNCTTCRWKTAPAANCYDGFGCTGSPNYLGWEPRHD